MNGHERLPKMQSEGRLVPRRDARIGGLLIEAGKLRPAELERVLELQRARGLRFGEAALRLGYITRDDLNRAVARQHDLPRPPVGSGIATSELVVAYDPAHPCAEDVRSLRTQLLMRWSGREPQPPAMAIVSPRASEGRSFLVANLAVAFAQLGSRTLLIDADLRAPRQHRIFGIPDHVGLSTVLSGRADREAVVPVLDFGPLSLLPAGACPPNPLELLTRPVFPAVLESLRAQFDVVLLDTPPARQFADAHGVAFRAGRALVLARKDHTRVNDLDDVVRELGDTGVSVVGTVFNAF